MDKLLPCPFCGEEPYFSQPVVGSEFFEVSCSTEDCGAMGQMFKGKAEAAAMWNRRTPPPQTRAVAQKSPPLGQASQVEVKRHERPEQGGMEGALAALAQDRSILDEGASRCNCAQATSRQPVPIAAPSSPEGGT